MFRVHTPIIRSFRCGVAAYDFLHLVFGWVVVLTYTTANFLIVFNLIGVDKRKYTVQHNNLILHHRVLRVSICTNHRQALLFKQFKKNRRI